MRKSLLGAGTLAGIATLAAAAIGDGLLAVAPKHHMGRSRYGAGTRPRRSWYKPHQGPREIARRVRQEERNRERQLLRGAQARAWEASLFGLNTTPEPGDLRLSRRGNVL